MIRRIPRIVGITGRGLGTGKSLSLTLLGYLGHLNGKKVWSNIWQGYPHKYLWGGEMLEQALEDQAIRNAMILWDDINTLIDSRLGMARVNRVASYIGQQARKLDNVLVFTTVKLVWTDVRLDDLADWLIYCYFDEEEEQVTWQVTDKRYFPPLTFMRRFNAPPLYRLFNTEEVVTPESLRARKSKRRRR